MMRKRRLVGDMKVSWRVKQEVNSKGILFGMLINDFFAWSNS